jgi:hypothetical protein
VTPLLCGLLVLVVFVADHPRLFPRARRALLTLDSAIPDEAQLRAHIENRLGVEVRHLIVQEINFVQDLTIVDVRFRAPVGGSLRVGTHASTDVGEPGPFAHLHPLATSNGVPEPGTVTPRSNGARADQIH